MRARKVPILLGAALVATLLPVGSGRGQEGSPVKPYRHDDRSVTALNVLPPGQGRYLNDAELLIAQSSGQQPPHNTDQIEIYDSLVQAAPDVKAAELSTYFKDASFGVEGEVEREYSPRAGVVVQRDAAFGVPHVYGTTRGDVMFGAGYVSAEDRMFMMDTLRHVGRGRLSEFLGASEANLASDRAAYLTGGYTEEELQAMIDRLEEVHPTLGPQAIQDVLDYTDGVNAFFDEAMVDQTKLPAEYKALQVAPEEWKPTDTVAVATLIGSQLGVGGGRELGNARFLSALRKAGHNQKQALRIFRDLRFIDDPESSVTTPKRFAWNTKLGTPKPGSRALPDDAEDAEAQAARARLPEHIDGPFGPIPLSFPDGMSNALLIDKRLSKTGRPLAVMGPQTAYWSPQILMEIDMHGPGIAARGVGFPGISQYVLLGRGRNYAWSATSAGGDQVDTFAYKLCDPEGGEPTLESGGYRGGGECKEIYSRTDTWTAKPTAGGVPGGPDVVVSMTTERIGNAIIQARDTVKGKPVAFATLRASFGKEVDSALTYVEIQDPRKIKGAQDFRKAFARFTFTFNWFYLDHKDIAFQLGGLHPVRAKKTDPDFPVWGGKRWRWRRMLRFKETPWAISPAKAYLTSWNNKQAKGWRAADSQWSFGPVHRVDPLDAGIKSYKRRGRKMTLTDVVNVMGDAATVDLRGLRVLPHMLDAVGKPGDERVAGAVALLRTWQRSGAHRRDRDGDGSYDHAPAVALMDAWWERALEAAFRPVLGDAYDVLPVGTDDKPRAQGSAYQNGLYSHLQKDLRALLGKRVKGGFSRGYCGEGKLGACRDALRASLDAAIAELEEAYGADPAAWDADEDGDRIQFTPVGVQGQDAMQWQNRPTFQQVLEFRGP